MTGVQTCALPIFEELLETWSAPRSLVVVSSDHRVQRAARQRGATFVDSEQWYAELLVNRSLKNALAEDAAAKPSGKPTPDELAYWLSEFGDTPSASPDLDNPFPPGYADDVEEDA